MKRKVVSLLLCAALVTQSTVPVWAEDLLSSGEAEILDSVTLDDGAAAAEPGVTDGETQEENQGTEITSEEEKPQKEAGERNIIDSGTCGEKVTWTLDDTGLLIISGEGEMEDYQGNSPFKKDSTKIKSVVIEEGVTSIGDYLFRNCVRLTEITISNSVTSIGERAFDGCNNLESIVLPDSVAVIEGSAFYGCSSLTNISIPESVTEIGAGAFLNCDSLTNISIPNSVTHIRRDIFQGCSNLVSIAIPESVVEIGAGAFQYCEKLENIDIPNSVASIGSEAFESCDSLTNISIPDSVTEIGSGAFTHCYNLKNIVLPANLTEINESLFWKCTGLTSVVIPDKVTDIGNDAFSYCGSLKSVTIPPSVTFIGTTAFDNSNNVTIWGERTSYAETYANKKGIHFRVIGEDANSGTCGENLTWVLDENGCLKISGTGVMFEYSDSKQSPFYGNADIKTVEIGEGVTSIGNFAFANCGNLESITIPNSVIAIGEQAFANADKVSIQAHIDSYAKEYAETHGIPFISLDGEDANSGTCGENLTWVLDENGCLKISGTGEMYEYSDSNKSPFYRKHISSIEIEEGVTSIGDFAFENCFIREGGITIPRSVCSIGENAFLNATNVIFKIYGDSYANEYAKEHDIQIWILGDIVDSGKCGDNLTWTLDKDGLLEISGTGEMYDSESYTPFEERELFPDDIQKVIIHEGVTSIGAKAFEQRNNLSSVQIPESIKTIGDNAFWWCSELTDVIIPDRVESIGENAFSNCSKLTMLRIPDTVTDIRFGAFQNCKNLTSINIPKNIEHIADATFNNCESLANITIPSSVTEIGTEAFNGCSSLTEIVVPDSVTRMGARAFLDCTSLSKVTLPDSITSIEGSTFRGCDSLKEITLPDTITKIGESAFLNCDILESVKIPEGVTSIGANAFEACNKLKTITLPSSVTELGSSIFENCQNLEEVKLLGGVKTIGDSVFKNCRSLKKLEIPEGAKSIGANAFEECRKLTTVALPDSITSVGANAFEDCASLTEITIPESITSIEQYTFNRCTGLKEIVIPEGVKNIENCAFYGCTGLKEVTIPKSVTRIGVSVFKGAASLTIAGYENSYAEKYAEKEKIPFKALKDEVHTHIWDNGKITKYPTCTSTGTRTYTCTSCGATKTTTIAAAGHSWNSGTVTKEPTCTEKGVRTYKCKDCGATRTEFIPKLEHKFKGNIVKATFTKDGSISGVCELCGEKVENKVINCISSIELSQSKYVYNGTERRPEVTLKDSKGKTVSPSDYTVSYPAESKTPGTYTLTITLKGDYYEGTATREYTVAKANQTVKLDDAVKRIDSKTVTLKAQITQGNKSGKFTYTSDNPEVASVTSWGKVTFHKVGKVNITVTTKGNGNYNSASKTMTLTIIPAPTAITKLQSQKPGWLNIQYRANREADGYQIQYGTSPDMKNAKYAAVKNSAVRSYTRKDVKSGETYFVRVRTFNVVDGERIYSNWSSVKSVGVK